MTPPALLGALLWLLPATAAPRPAADAGAESNGNQRRGARKASDAGPASGASQRRGASKAGGVRAGQPAGGASGGAQAAAAQSRAACSRGRQPALSELACAIDRQLAGVPAGSVLLTAGLEADSKVPRKAGLLARVTKVIAGRLGVRPLHGERAQEPRRGLPLGARVLRLRGALKRGRLALTVDVEGGRLTIWDRTLGRRPGVLRHAFARRPIDAEIRSFLPAPPLLLEQLVKAPAPERDALAVACGDLQGHGGLELAVVGRGGVHVGRLGPARFVRRAHRSWASLSAISPTPLRQPLGTARIQGRQLLVGISDRRHAALLDQRLRLLRKLPRQAPWPGTRDCVPFDALGYRNASRSCAAGPNPGEVARGTGEPSPAEAPADAGAAFPQLLDALAGTRLSSARGEAYLWVRAARHANRPRVVLRRADGARAELSPAGAQLALADLDLDGHVELLVSRSTLTPANDALTVYSWRPPNQLTERLTRPVGSAIRAITACPPDSAGLRRVVVLTSTELWVLS